MKRIITIMLLVVVLVTMATAPAEAKTKHKAKAKATVTKTIKQKSTSKKIKTGSKIKKVVIHCPCCGDGHDNKCPYWYREDGHEQHMTDEQIEEYNFTESHYQDESGNWIEK